MRIMVEDRAIQTAGTTEAKNGGRKPLTARQWQSSPVIRYPSSNSHRHFSWSE